MTFTCFSACFRLVDSQSIKSPFPEDDTEAEKHIHAEHFDRLVLLEESRETTLNSE